MIWREGSRMAVKMYTPGSSAHLSRKIARNDAGVLSLKAFGAACREKGQLKVSIVCEMFDLRMLFSLQSLIGIVVH